MSEISVFLTRLLKLAAKLFSLGHLAATPRQADCTSFLVCLKTECAPSGHVSKQKHSAMT